MINNVDTNSREFKCMTIADQCRAMGLRAGDTIECRRLGGMWCSIKRIKLLWVGDTQAVWLMTSKGSTTNAWTTPVESFEYTLGGIDWRMVRGLDDGEDVK